jgi:hypothetical protein
MMVADAKHGTMNETLSEAERTNWTEADTRRTLLSAAAILLVFLIAHWLLLWLHPLGAHRFLWNLALGGLTSWLLVRRLIPHRNAEGFSQITRPQPSRQERTLFPM